MGREQLSDRVEELVVYDGVKLDWELRKTLHFFLASTILSCVACDMDLVGVGGGLSGRRFWVKFLRVSSAEWSLDSPRHIMVMQSPDDFLLLLIAKVDIGGR